LIAIVVNAESLEDGSVPPPLVLYRDSDNREVWKTKTFTWAPPVLKGVFYPARESWSVGVGDGIVGLFDPRAGTLLYWTRSNPDQLNTAWYGVVEEGSFFCMVVGASWFGICKLSGNPARLTIWRSYVNYLGNLIVGEPQYHDLGPIDKPLEALDVAGLTSSMVVQIWWPTYDEGKRNLYVLEMRWADIRSQATIWQPERPFLIYFYDDDEKPLSEMDQPYAYVDCSKNNISIRNNYGGIRTTIMHADVSLRWPGMAWAQDRCMGWRAQLVALLREFRFGGGKRPLFAQRAFGPVHVAGIRSDRTKLAQCPRDQSVGAAALEVGIVDDIQHF
jgi:hypothetical protein